MGRDAGGGRHSAAMRQRNSSFLVYTLDEGRWTVGDVIKYKEDRALEKAEALLSSRQYDAVKVVQEDGTGHERVVFEKTCARRAQKPLTIAPIDTAPPCSDLDDFYRFTARRAMGQLFRRYLDRECLTVLEIMHLQGHVKVLVRRDTLVNQAVSRVATLHAATTGRPQVECLDALDRAVIQIRDRALPAGDAEVLGKLLAEGGFPAVAAKAGKDSASDRDFLIRGALAHHLGTAAGWAGKIEVALELLAVDANRAGVPFIDEALAEILDGAEAIKEILGRQPDLSSALHALSDLARGRHEAPKPAPEFLTPLNDALGRHRLTASRQVLLDRMRRELGGIKPLTQNPTGQGDAFVGLLRGLVVPLGLRGGTSMTAAVVQRARLVYQDHGTPEQATRRVADHIPVPLSRIGFLIGLAGSDLADKTRPAIEDLLGKTIDRIVRLSDALPGAKRTAALNAALDELAERARAVDLDDTLRDRVADTLARLKDERAINPEATLTAARAEEMGEAAAPNETEVLPPVLHGHGLKYVTFRQGETMFEEGAKGNRAYYLVNGLAVRAHGKDDKDRSVETINPDNLIGGEVLTGRVGYKSTVQALTNLEAYAVPARLLEKRVERLAERDPLMHFVLTSLGRV